MASLSTLPVLSYAVKGSYRQFAVPSCLLSGQDLRRLYKLLKRRAEEASSREVEKVHIQPGQTEEQLGQVKQWVASQLDLVVTVAGRRGDWVAASGDGVLSDEALPDSIVRIIYDSAHQFRNQFKRDPDNSCVVVTDFSRTHILDLSNLALSPDPNESSVRVSGVDDTWVKAVCEDLKSFFDERRKPRGWLHHRFSYDVLLWLLGIPASFLVVYRIDRLFNPSLALPISLASPLYVLLFVLALLIFRIIFNYSRWVFPKVEGPGRMTWPTFHKAVLILIGGTLVSLLVESTIGILGVGLFGNTIIK